MVTLLLIFLEYLYYKTLHTKVIAEQGIFYIVQYMSHAFSITTFEYTTDCSIRVYCSFQERAHIIYFCKSFQISIVTESGHPGHILSGSFRSDPLLKIIGLDQVM